VNFVKNLRALIVDDSSIMRKIVERSLRQAGMEFEQIKEASNGAEALAILDRSAMDLVVCDINMPIMDGVEFLRRLKEVPTAKNVPVVMITTEAGEAKAIQALSAGARGYIRKPFTAEQVKEQLIPLLPGI
jgi:two-component system, chemotaxis family, chemotaxis protein CheY